MKLNSNHMKIVSKCSFKSVFAAMALFLLSRLPPTEKLWLQRVEWLLVMNSLVNGVRWENWLLDVNGIWCWTGKFKLKVNSTCFHYFLHWSLILHWVWPVNREQKNFRKCKSRTELARWLTQLVELEYASRLQLGMVCRLGHALGMVCQLEHELAP